MLRYGIHGPQFNSRFLVRGLQTWFLTCSSARQDHQTDAICVLFDPTHSREIQTRSPKPVPNASPQEQGPLNSFYRQDNQNTPCCNASPIGLLCRFDKQIHFWTANFFIWRHPEVAKELALFHWNVPDNRDIQPNSRIYRHQTCFDQVHQRVSNSDRPLREQLLGWASQLERRPDHLARGPIIHILKWDEYLWINAFHWICQGFQASLYWLEILELSGGFWESKERHYALLGNLVLELPIGKGFGRRSEFLEEGDWHLLGERQRCILIWASKVQS